METISEHLLHAQIENLRLLSTQKLSFVISRRRDFGMAGLIIMSLLLLSNCSDKFPHL